jgi:hypothetical protein
MQPGNSKKKQQKEREHEIKHIGTTLRERITRHLQRGKSIAQGVAEDGKRGLISRIERRFSKASGTNERTC